MARQFPELPFASDLDAPALAWAQERGRYTSGEMRDALAARFELTEAQRDLRLSNGRRAFDNYVDWLLAGWSRSGRHVRVSRKGEYLLQHDALPSDPVHPVAECMADAASESASVPSSEPPVDAVAVEAAGTEALQEDGVPACRDRVEAVESPAPSHSDVDVPEAPRKVEVDIGDLEDVEGLRRALAVRMVEGGIKSRDALADLSGEELMDIIPDITRAKANKIVMSARAHWFAKSTGR